MRFNDKVAIVTGAASGIGLATAKRFAREGAQVVIAELKGDKAAAAADECKRAGSEAIGVTCDVADERQVEATVKVALTRFGRIDTIVNNAGLMVFKPLQEQTTSDWERVLKVDLLGAFHFI